MCIAIFQSMGKEISREHLQNCWDANDDGAGVCWAYEGKLYVYKELKNFDTFYDYYKHLVDTIGATSPMMLHFRIRTHGLISLENCHPQFITDNLAFIHNGILSSLVNIPKTSTKSDTGEFNEQILKQLPGDFLSYPGVLKMLEYCCKGSKLVFMDGQGRYLILNEGAGDWVDGVWYSNTSWKTKAYTAHDYSYLSAKYNHGNFREWDSDTGWAAAQQTAEIHKQDTATDLLAQAYAEMQKNTCLICGENELKTDTDKTHGVCGECRLRNSWAGDYVDEIEITEMPDMAMTAQEEEDINGNY
jgi:hypothetical protein